jgi:hypothetical protein
VIVDIIAGDSCVTIITGDAAPGCEAGNGKFATGWLNTRLAQPLGYVCVLR